MTFQINKATIGKKSWNTEDFSCAKYFDTSGALQVLIIVCCRWSHNSNQWNDRFISKQT